MWIFGSKKPLDERMEDEIGAEAEKSKELCEELHEEFLARLRRRDEAREALEAVNEEIRDLQGVGVSLLGRLNAAMEAGDESRLDEFRKAYKQNSRELDRVGRRREKAARELAEADLNEREAAEELSRAAAAVVEDHAEHTGRVKERLKALMDALDERHEEVALSAVPLAEEHERRSRPRAELEEAE
jgi:hypothetical protein